MCRISKHVSVNSTVFLFTCLILAHIPKHVTILTYMLKTHADVERDE